MKIISREFEQAKLDKIYTSNEAEFVAVYGRRRIGKTYLIREFFNKKACLFFRASGIRDAALALQLDKFKTEIEQTFYKGRKSNLLPDFNNWHDAFAALTDAIDLTAGKQKVVIFLDELPWMATPKSGLLEALDYYWNRHWSANKYIRLIICGSAASWIIENILKDTGGLHNRVTLKLPLEPFTLAETKTYLKSQRIHYTNQQILTLYLCLGGIPFYLRDLEKNLSAIQNINQLCFHKRGALHNEYDALFASLFKHHEHHQKIIEFIARKREGINRTELENKFQKC